MTQVDEAKAALAEYVKHSVPESEQRELSRLTAAFVAAVVRQERAAARTRVEAAARYRSTLDSIFASSMRGFA